MPPSFKIKVPTLITSYYLDSSNLEAYWVDLFNEIEIFFLDQKQIKLIKVSGYKIKTNHLNPIYQMISFLHQSHRGMPGIEVRVMQNTPTDTGFYCQMTHAAFIFLHLNQRLELNYSLNQIQKIWSDLFPARPDLIDLVLNANHLKKSVALMQLPNIVIDSSWLQSQKKSRDDPSIQSILSDYFFDFRRLLSFGNSLKVESVVCGKGPILAFFSEKIDHLEPFVNLKGQMKFFYAGVTCFPDMKLID